MQASVHLKLVCAGKFKVQRYRNVNIKQMDMEFVDLRCTENEHFHGKVKKVDGLGHLGCGHEI